MEKTKVSVKQLSVCDCGAITITIDGIDYSCSREYFNEHFEIIDGSFRSRKINKFSCCNHCVNHWGLDICACGSGEKVGECDGEFECCNTPSQDIETCRPCFKAEDSLTQWG